MDQRIRSRIPLLSPSNISRCRGGGKKKKRVNSSRVTIERADLHTCNDSMEESKRWKQRMNEKEGGEKRRTRREEKKREKERGGRLYFDSDGLRPGGNIYIPTHYEIWRVVSGANKFSSRWNTSGNTCPAKSRVSRLDNKFHGNI